MQTRTQAVIVSVLLVARVGAASGTMSSEPGGDPLAPLLDPVQWIVVQSSSVGFAPDQRRMQVQLLKSIPVTGRDGVGRPLHSVNLAVGVSGRLLYTFAPAAVPPFDSRRADPVYYMDDRGADAGALLGVRDVTGDQVPEIIFRSGWAAASSFATNIHVLQYSAATAGFRDIRGDRFFESRWQKFRWFEGDRGTLAVVAVPVEPSDDPLTTCHGCPKFHDYEIYHWDQGTLGFVRVDRLVHTAALHQDGDDPFQHDWAYVTEKVGRSATGQDGSIR